MKNKFLIFIGPLVMMLAACAPLSFNTSKKDAIEQFQRDAVTIPSDNTSNSLEPKRNLIQFSYGPDSLKNARFLDFLKLSNANLDSNLIEKIKELENTEASRDFSDELQEIETQINAHLTHITFFKKLNTQHTASYFGLKKSKVLAEILEPLGLKSEFTGQDYKISQSYSQKISDILRAYAEGDKTDIYLSNDFKTLYFSKEKIENTHIIEIKKAQEYIAAEEDFKSIKKSIENIPQLSEGEVFLDQKTLKTKIAKDFVAEILKKLKSIEILTSKNQELSQARQHLLAFSENNKNDSNQDIKTVAIYDKELKNGSEKVVEKISVYNITPAEMKKNLENYKTLFPPDVCSSQNAGDKNDKNDKTKDSKDASSEKASIEKEKEAVLSLTKSGGCLLMDADSTGIVLKGFIPDVEIAEHILLQQDRPTKQILIEAFILEVSSGWQEKIQSKLNTNLKATDLNFVTSGTGITTFPAITTGLTGKFERNNINYLINLIETNSIGRKISNPVILVRNKEKGVVEKKRTVIELVTTVTAGSGGVNQTATKPEKLESTLNLSVTPEVNLHNNSIDLDFNFIEEIRDNDTYLSPVTSNKITTKLSIEAGSVVLMAGLRKENNAKTSNGIPGLARMSIINRIFAPLSALFGGDQFSEQTTSELLVLINPTVISPKNIGNTINKAKN